MELSSLYLMQTLSPSIATGLHRNNPEERAMQFCVGANAVPSAAEQEAHGLQSPIAPSVSGAQYAS
jgi:hypothetical protein